MERVEFSLGFSRALLVFMLLLHLTTILILCSLPILFEIKCLGTALILLHARQALQLHVFRSSKSAIIKIWQDHNANWGIKTQSEDWPLALLDGQSFITQYFMILGFHLKSRITYVIIMRDAVTTHQYRVLSTRIKFFS